VRGAVGFLSRHQAGADLERVKQQQVDVAGERETEQETDHQRHRADDQTPPQLDQVFEERRAGGLYLAFIVCNAQGVALAALEGAASTKSDAAGSTDSADGKRAGY